jgi:hypothetical protein
MKRLLAYLFLVLILVCSTNQSVVFAEKKRMVTVDSDKVLEYKTPDINFPKLLKWSKSSYDDPPFRDNSGEYKKMVKEMGDPCFRHWETTTYDGKQIAFEFISRKIHSSDQTNTCVIEVYKIWAEPANSINYVAGLSSGSGEAIAKPFRYSRDSRRTFAVVVTNDAKRLCFKWPSDRGVIDTCYNLRTPQREFSKIITARLNAIKLREEAKGNVVVTTTPTEIETSVTDTSGPQIEVPGKLIAKNDQVILSGKITDENNIASVKIDNSPIVLDKEGNFEIDLFVPLDGLKVSIEAIDKFTNKTSRTIVISREQKESGEQIVKLPSLNPTKIDAKDNPNALALIVGITNYKNIPISIYADKDAKLFADYAYRSLGISRDKIKLLVNDSANYIEIKTSLKRWLKNEIVEDKSDVYIFFAGHGLVSDNQKDLYLIPYDGEPSLLGDTSFMRSDLFSLIDESKPGSVTAFFDTCYSGLTRQNEMLVADARPIKIVADETSLPSNVNLISAASNNEIASSLEEAEHGMFSYYLMEGLGGNADLDQNKNITVGELHEYVKNRVKEKAAKLGRDQNPQVSGNKDKVLVKLN